MVNSSREANKSLEILDNSSQNNWKFNSNDLDLYLTRLKFHLSRLDESADVFLSKIRLFIYKVLQGSYKKQENLEIIKFFSEVIQYFLEWAKNVSIPNVSDILNYSTLQCFAKVNLMVSGLDDFHFTFHETCKKFSPKKEFKPWEGSILKSTSNGLTLFFINLFGKMKGFELFYKILLSEACMELILDFHMFSMLKFVQKPFLDDFMEKFLDLLSVKLTVFSERNMDGVNFDSVYEVYEKSEEIEILSSCSKLRMKLIEEVLSSGSTFMIKQALSKLKSLVDKNKDLIKQICESQALNVVLHSNDLEIFSIFQPVLIQMTSSLNCDQVKEIYKAISSDIIGASVAEYLLMTCKKLSKSGITTIFDSFSRGSFEEVLFATQFTENIFESFEFNYYEFNRDFFDDLLNCDDVTYNNLGILILSKLYHRYSINPKVTNEIIDHIHKIEKGVNIVQNARLLVDLDRLNTNFKHHLSEKSALSTIGYIKNQEDSVYESREKIQFLLKYLEIYVKYSKKISKKMFSDLFLFLKNSANEDAFLDWMEKCIVFFAPDVTEKIFVKHFLTCSDFQSWSIFSFRCFLRIYLLINSYDRCIELKKSCFLMRLQKLLRNTDTLVELTLNCNDLIFLEGCEILVNLHLKLGENLDNSRKNIWEDFFSLVLRNCNTLTKPRVLKMIKSFIRPAEDSGYGLLFFLYKFQEEQFNEVYIDQCSDVRSLKKKVASKYGRNYWNTVFLCDDSRYGRYEDDVRVKFLNQNTILIDFENETKQLLTIEEFFTGSFEIQKFLLQVLNEEQEYSKIAFDVLTAIPFSEFAFHKLLVLDDDVRDIVKSTFFTFAFQIKIIENFMNDEKWLEKFLEKGGVTFLISIFNENSWNDVEFNKDFLVISLKLMQKFQFLVSESLIRRIFLAICFVSLSEVDVEGIVIEIFFIIKEFRIDFYEDFCQDSVFFLKFWENIGFLGQNTKISVQVLNYFVELAEKSQKVLDLTLRYILQDLLHYKSSPSIKNELFIYLKRFLQLSESSDYHQIILSILKDGLISQRKKIVSGLLNLLESKNFSLSENDLNFILSSILSSVFFLKSKKTRKNLLNYLKSLFTFTSEQKKLMILPHLEISCHSSLQNNYSTSSDSLFFGSFSLVRFCKSFLNPYLNVILHQLFFQSSIRKLLFSNLYQPDSFSFQVQKIFRRLEKNSTSLFKPDTFYEIIEKISEFSLDKPTDLCSYFKVVVQQLKRESSNFPMVGQILNENHKTKGCEHIESREVLPFKYLSIRPGYKDLLESLENIFQLETKQIECEKCGTMNFIQSHRYLYKSPEILTILIERLNQVKLSSQIPIFNRVLYEFDLNIDLKKFKHVNCQTNLKYELTGIISFDSSINSFASYCKVEGFWMQARDSDLKMMKDNEFVKDLFGIRQQSEICTKTNTACVLIFNKSSNNRISRIEENWMNVDLVKCYFYMSYEFQEFVLNLIDSNSLKILKFCYFYFFCSVLRINDLQNVFKFFLRLMPKVRSDEFRKSEVLLETLKDLVMTQVLNGLNDKIKAQMANDLITLAIQQSRPSVCTGYLRYILEELKKNEKFNSCLIFEVIFKLCKLSPALAQEQGAEAVLFNSISQCYPKKELPEYLLLSFLLFYKTFSLEMLQLLSDHDFISLVIHLKHDFLTAVELGKTFVLLKNEIISDIFIEYLFEAITKDQKDTFFLQILGILMISKRDALMRTVMNKLKDFIFFCKQSNKDLFPVLEVVVLAVEVNEDCLDFLRMEGKVVKELFKATGKMKKSENFISCFDLKTLKKKLKIIKDKSKKYLKDPTSKHLKKPHQNIEDHQIIYNSGSTLYFKSNEKLRFFNEITGKS